MTISEILSPVPMLVAVQVIMPGQLRSSDYTIVKDVFFFMWSSQTVWTDKNAQFMFRIQVYV